MQKPQIICYGEVLWDFLPSGKVAGGAPMNVAYHTKQLGLSSKMLSKIGSDEDGESLLAFLQEKGVDNQLIQKDFTYPTGIVNVSLDVFGSPSYEIVSPAAWDFIYLDEEVISVIESSNALVYGSLACRAEKSRDTLFQILDIAKLKVLDVNLRPPFYTQGLLEYLLGSANIVKLNEDELSEICGWYEVRAIQERLIEFISKKFELNTVIVTLGAKGVHCFHENNHYFQSGLNITVQDTIGSGDAFLGGFLSKYLTGHRITECLEFANASGAYVATQRGGTPEISIPKIEEFIKSFPKKMDA